MSLPDDARPADPRPVHLRAAGVSLVLDARDGLLPAVLHWGHDLGDVSAAELAALAVAAVPGHGAERSRRPRPRGRPAARARRGLERAAGPRRVAVGSGLVAPVHPDRSSTSHRRPRGRHRSRRRRGPHRPRSRSSCCRRVSCASARRSPPRADGFYGRRRPAPHAAGAAGRDRAVRPRGPLGPRALAAAAALRRRRALPGEPARSHRPGRPARSSRRARPGSTRAAARSGPCTWRGAATTSPTPSGSPTARAVLGGGELLLPGEIVLGSGRELHGAVGLRRARGRPRRARGPLPRPPAGPPAAPAPPAPGRDEHLGGGVLRPRPRRA